MLVNVRLFFPVSFQFSSISSSIWKLLKPKTTFFLKNHIPSKIRNTDTTTFSLRETDELPKSWEVGSSNRESECPTPSLSRSWLSVASIFRWVVVARLSGLTCLGKIFRPGAKITQIWNIWKLHSNVCNSWKVGHIFKTHLYVDFKMSETFKKPFTFTRTTYSRRKYLT